MRAVLFIAAITIAALFSGCLYQAWPAGNASASASAAAKESPTPSVTPVPSPPSVSTQPPFVKVDFVESGGLAGNYRKQISVSKDGVVYVNDNGRAQTKTLSGGELSSLAKSLLDSGIFSAVSSNLSTCPDAYDVSLVAEVAEKKKKFEKGAYCPQSSPGFERAAAVLRALAR